MNETILVVEDDAAVRQLVRRILVRGGYTVLEASDGEEALDVAQQHAGSIRLLVTDVVMPKIGGRELVWRLSEANPELRVLYISGYTDEEQVRQGMTSHPVGFVSKPFEPEALLGKVREILH